MELSSVAEKQRNGEYMKYGVLYFGGLDFLSPFVDEGLEEKKFLVFSFCFSPYFSFCAFGSTFNYL